jgi:hypothetical protein
MYRGTYSTVSRRRRRFHRLGIFVATTIMAIGLAIIAAGVVRLQLLEVLQQETLTILFGMALVPLAVVGLAVYGVVRAIGWATDAH